MVVNKTHPMGLITHLEVVGCFKLRCIAPFIQKPWPGPSRAYSTALAWRDDTQSRPEPSQAEPKPGLLGQDGPDQPK